MPEATDTQAVLRERLAEAVWSLDEEEAVDAILSIVTAHTAEIEAERDRLAAQVKAVRELHQPVEGRTGWGADDDPTPGSYGSVTPACGPCGSQDDAVRWPCPTIQALDGTGEA